MRGASGPPFFSCRVSSRELAKATNVARSNIVAALDTLQTRNIIATRERTATRAAAYIVNPLRLIPGPRRAAAAPRTSSKTISLLLR